MKLLCGKKLATGSSTGQSFGGYSFVFSEKIEQVAEEWSRYCVADTLMDIPFLKTIEEHHPPSIIPFYCLVFSDQKLVGIIYFQTKKFKLKESLQLDCEDNNLWQRLVNWNKKQFAGFINFNTLVMGNLMLTGQYGFKFSDHVWPESSLEYQNKNEKGIPSELLTNLYKEAMNYASNNLGIKCSAILCKDFSNEMDLLQLSENGFHKIEVQPDMIFNLDPTWKTFDDYLEALESKYRVRYRRARKKLGKIYKRTLASYQVAEYLPEIEKLYLNIVKNAGFNLFYLNGNFFKALKENLGDDFEINAYFEQEKLVGFSTVIKNFDEQYCFFLGYNSEINRENQLYLNMLYDFIEKAIDMRMSRVIMSRTAIEIKSSVGAVPEKRFAYFRHNNPFIHGVFQYIFKWMYQNKTWQLRSPYK